MQWWHIVIVVYLLLSLPAAIAVEKLIAYCRRRSIFDHPSTDFIPPNMSTWYIKAFVVIGWPMSLASWTMSALVIRRHRKGFSDEHSAQHTLVPPEMMAAFADEKNDGKPYFVERMRGDNASDLGITVIATVDGMDAVVQFFSPDKLNALIENEPFFKDLIAQTREHARKLKENPKLRLIKTDVLGNALNGKWFYGRMQGQHALNPMLLKLVPDAPCAFLAIFDKPDDAELERVFGCNVKENGITSHMIDDGPLFLETLGSYANDKPVRVVTNVQKTGAGQWTFDTICEITSRAASPESRPPAA